MAKSGQYLDDLKFDPDKIADRMIREIVDNPQAMGAGGEPAGQASPGGDGRAPKAQSSESR